MNKTNLSLANMDVLNNLVAVVDGSPKNQNNMRTKNQMKLIALNFPPRNADYELNRVVGCNIYTELCGDVSQEDSVYMNSHSYNSVFGENRRDSSRRMKRLSVVKISPKEGGHPIYRKYVRNPYFKSLEDNQVALNPASIREMCSEGQRNSDLVGGDVVVSKGSCFMYYWNHPFHATRISMRLGVASILLALISIVIALLV